jgi:hypothetical protein
METATGIAFAMYKTYLLYCRIGETLVRNFTESS